MLGSLTRQLSLLRRQLYLAPTCTFSFKLFSVSELNEKRFRVIGGVDLLKFISTVQATCHRWSSSSKLRNLIEHGLGFTVG